MSEFNKGDTVEFITNAGGNIGRTATVKEYSDGKDDSWVRVTVDLTGSEDGWRPSCFKLIKKGKTKVKPQIKGLKVNAGSKIFDTSRGVVGIVAAGTDKSCIYNEISTGAENIAPWSNIKLEIETPTSIILPVKTKKTTKSKSKPKPKPKAKAKKKPTKKK